MQNRINFNAKKPHAIWRGAFFVLRLVSELVVREWVIQVIIGGGLVAAALPAA